MFLMQKKIDSILNLKLMFQLSVLNVNRIVYFVILKIFSSAFGQFLAILFSHDIEQYVIVTLNLFL